MTTPTRIARGLAALVALAAMTLGLPTLLLTWGKLPDLARIDWVGLLTTPTSAMTLVTLVTVAAWIAWAVLMVLLALEIISYASGHRIRLRIPGLGAGHRMVAGLLVAVIALSTAQMKTASAAPTAPPAPRATVSAPVNPGTPQHTAPRAAAPDAAPRTAPDTQAPTVGERGTPETSAARRGDHVMHTIRNGDHLWRIAENYYGDGGRWRDISRANPDIDPAELVVGEQLVVPNPTRNRQPAAPAVTRVGQNGPTATVQLGEGPWQVAQRTLGDGSRWREIVNLNADTIGADHVLEVGQVLRLPAPAAPPTQQAPQPAPAPAQPAPAPAPAQAPQPAPAPAPEPQQAPPDSVPAPAPVPGPAQPAPAPTPADQLISRATIAAAEPGLQGAAALGVGALLAAGLIGTINRRRDLQLRSRRPGQRIEQPSDDAQITETAIRQEPTPLMVGSLDTVMRAVGAHAHSNGTDLPALAAVRVAPDRVDLLLSGPAPQAPPGVTLSAETVWTIHAADVATLTQVEGLATTAHPYPGLVSLGRDEATAHVLIDLESARTLTVAAEDTDSARGALHALISELAVSPWSYDLQLVLIGDACPHLETALAEPAAHRLPDLDTALAHFEALAADQRAHLTRTATDVGQNRLDPDVADAWMPHILVTNEALTEDQRRRIAAIVADETLPKVSIAAVGTHSADGEPWSYTIDRDHLGHLEPLGLTLTPQILTDVAYAHVLELLTASGSTTTRPAPWWDHSRVTDTLSTPVEDAAEPETDAADHLEAELDEIFRHVGQNDTEDQVAEAAAAPQESAEDGEPDGGTEEVAAASAGQDDDGDRVTAGATPVTRIDSRRRRPLNRSLSGMLSSESTVSALPDRQSWTAVVEEVTARTPRTPTLRILGPVELVGAAGEPNRSPRRCEILIQYLLEHPGTSSAHVADRMVISRATVKSVMNYTRKWLGDDPVTGEAYLPGGGTHGYTLHPDVTSDWQQVRELTARGVNCPETSTLALVEALAHVRGPLLEGASPHDWAHAETLRTDAPALLADIALELGQRALRSGDLKLARWAATQGLLIDQGSEPLLVLRAQTEHRAGNYAEVARLTEQIHEQARQLGLDVDDDTLTTLQAIAN